MATTMQEISIHAKTVERDRKITLQFLTQGTPGNLTVTLS